MEQFSFTVMKIVNPSTPAAAVTEVRPSGYEDMEDYSPWPQGPSDSRE